MKRVAIFASGSGSNAENIVRYFRKDENVTVPLILSNKKDAYIHERAKRWGVPSFSFTKKEFDEADLILEMLAQYEIDFIVLAGFLLKVSEPILKAYPGSVVNIHPALLPKFGGKGMYGDKVHKAVVAAGEKVSGITIHYVNENYDEGDVIFQAECALSPADSPEEVAQKVHQLEYRWFPQVIAEVLKKGKNNDFLIKNQNQEAFSSL